MHQVTYWPSEVRGFGPASSGWRLACPLVETPAQAPHDRLRADDLHVHLGSYPAPDHWVQADAIVARQWAIPIGVERAQVHAELRHTVVVRPGAYVVWADQLTSRQFHHYTSAVRVAGDLVAHDRDVRHIVVRRDEHYVKLALAADYDATLVEGDGRVRVDLRLRGHNTRFLVAAFAAATQDALADCTLRVSDGPVVEVRTAAGSEWVLHANALRQPRWIDRYQTDARWAVLEQGARLTVAEASSLKGPDGHLLIDESAPVSVRTLDLRSSPEG